MNYYIMRNGQTYGPYSEEVVRKYLAEGSMLGTDQGRTDGMSNWVPLSQLLAKESASQSQAPPAVPESKPDYAASATPPLAPAAKAYVPPVQQHVPASVASKRQYLDSIRAHSAYPTYRGFIGVIAIIGYVVAGIVAIGALIGGLVSMKMTPGVGLAVIAGGLIYAAILFLMARFFKEAALILADLADSTVDANSHARTNEQ